MLQAVQCIVYSLLLLYSVYCTIDSLQFTVYRVVDKVKGADIVVYKGRGVYKIRYAIDGRDVDKGRGFQFTRFVV